jgi:hypothetical protein
MNIKNINKLKRNNMVLEDITEEINNKNISTNTLNEEKLMIKINKKFKYSIIENDNKFNRYKENNETDNENELGNDKKLDNKNELGNDKKLGKVEELVNNSEIEKECDIYDENEIYNETETDKVTEIDEYEETYDRYLNLEEFVKIFPYRLFFDYEFKYYLYYLYEISDYEIETFETYLEYYLEIITNSNFNDFLKKVYLKNKFILTGEDGLYEFIFSQNKYFLYEITDEYENFFVYDKTIDKKFHIKNSLEDVD